MRFVSHVTAHNEIWHEWAWKYCFQWLWFAAEQFWPHRREFSFWTTFSAPRKAVWVPLIRAARKLKGWAEICPANLLNKLYLLEAEIAGLHGDSTKAHFLFNESVKHASIESFLHEEGLP
jgi:hypothetical protein